MTQSDRPSTQGPVVSLLMFAIVVYQRARAGRPSPCRFYPSCSQYGMEALKTHGALRGGSMTVQRVLRCRPGGPSGVDLVPPSVSLPRVTPFQG